MKPSTDFNAVRLEGGLVTPELLRLVAGGKAERQSPSDYDLAPDTRVIDEARAHWDRLRRAWAQWKEKSWQQGRPPEAESADTTGGTTRDQWQLPLLRALGFHNLAANPGLEVNGRRFPIARVYHASEGVRVPIHLVGAGIPLDKRTAGVSGAATDRPHAHVQAYLNEEPRALWGLISDGLVLRLLRDTTSLARPPFIEFDLVRIFEGDDFPSFAVMWLLCHATRFTGERPSDCALELWSQKAAKEGTRALDSLRGGVEKAIEALGDGFLSHPDNKPLADLVRSGALDKQELFQQVLRVVYRIIFVLVAEERDALHAPAATDQARSLYRSGYALGRIRDLAVSGFRGTAHTDLWRSASIVFERLAEGGAPELGLNALGSFLFSPASTPHLVGAGTFADPTTSARHALAQHRVELKNRDFLAAMRALSVVVDPVTKKERAVDFRALGAEELGSVYEGLLELHLDSASWPERFRLATSAGNERKTSGSYYTPDSLVQCLLDSALEPVIKEAAKGKKGADAAEAILNLKVCDPAVGSGHFLIAAAHRLAKHVARARAGDSEPTPDEHRTALREVIRRSMYGVDINPMSAELCRVALWMESMEPGKPLSFLESHIVVGNSLIGATPRLLAEGITDGAFEVLEGDEKAAVSALKKRNKQDRKDVKSGQGTFDFGAGGAAGTDFTSDFAQLATASDASAAEVASLARRHAELQQSAKYSAERLKADAWCAAFFWKKDGSALGTQAITEATFRSIEKSPEKYPIGHPIRNEIERLRREHGFLHLHLAFPEVFRAPNAGATPENEHCGWDGGFDCILGNPPWERVKLQEKEWFAERVPEIANAPNAAARTRMIKDLSQERPELHAQFLDDVRAAEAASAFMRGSGRYPLCGRGDVNLYSVFVEWMRDVIGSMSRIGCVVPIGLVTEELASEFLASLLRQNQLVEVLGFENEDFIFPNVHHSTKFALLVFRSSSPERFAPRIGFYLRGVAELADHNRFFRLEPAVLARLNPETNTIPVFRSAVDALLAQQVYSRCTSFALDRAHEDGWRWVSTELIHMANDSGEFRDASSVSSTDRAYWQDNAPLVEAKSFYFYDHRFGTYEGQTDAQAAQGKLPEISDELKANASYGTRYRYSVSRRWLSSQIGGKANWPGMLAWRKIARNTDRRTMIATLLPLSALANSGITTFCDSAIALSLLGQLNSFPFDYSLRQKLGGTNVSGYFTRQCALVPRNVLRGRATWCAGKTMEEWIIARVSEMSLVSDDLGLVSEELWPEGYGAVFRYDPERRFEIRCELDAAFFHLYLGSPEEWSRTASPELRTSLPTPRDAVAYIMDTFPIVKRKDEDAHGHYRTKDRILALYDTLTNCLATGQPFKSTLNPPPGPPTNSDGTFAALPAWPKGAPKPANWPAHVHPPVSHRS